MSNCLGVVLTDLHYGETVGDIFNTDIAEKRILEIPHSIHLSPAGRQHFDRIFLLFGGDLITGEDVYPGHLADTHMGGLDQADMVSLVLWKMILRFRKRYKTSIIDAYGVPGNHGKVSRSGYYATNWDRQVYVNLEKRIKNHKDPDIRLRYTAEQIMPFRMSGHTGLLTHRGTKHFGTPAMHTKVMRALRHYKADFMVQGHWHQAAFVGLDDVWHITGGALTPPNEFAKGHYLFAPPRQVYFTTHTDAKPWIKNFSYLEW